MVDADDFIVLGEEVCVDGSPDGVGDKVWLVDGFQAGFGDFEHERPVWAFFCSCGVGFVAVCELEGCEAGVCLRLVVGGVIGEDGRSVEWAIGFGEVELLSERREKEGGYPAFITNAFRSFASDTNSNDMSARIIKIFDTLLHNLCRCGRSLAHCDKLINWHCTHQFAIRNLRPILQLHRLVFQINVDDFGAQLEFVGRQSLCHSLPDPAGATVSRESERGIGSPIPRRLVQNDVFGNEFEVWCCHTFTEPAALHSCRRHGPDFEIIRTHKQIRNSLACSQYFVPTI